ncbi:hypothetical protein [Pseudonocardia sp. TMWB2A]
MGSVTITIDGAALFWIALAVCGLRDRRAIATALWRLALAARDRTIE